MNNIFIFAITTIIFLTGIYFISALIQLKETLKSLNKLIINTDENIKPALQELQQTIKSLRNLTDNVNSSAEDAKYFFGSARKVGEKVEYINGMVNAFTSTTKACASGLKAGLSSILKNFFKKGGDHHESKWEKL